MFAKLIESVMTGRDREDLDSGSAGASNVARSVADDQRVTRIDFWTHQVAPLLESRVRQIIARHPVLGERLHNEPRGIESGCGDLQHRRLAKVAREQTQRHMFTLTQQFEQISYARKDVAETYVAIGILHYNTNRSDDALGSLQRAQEISEQLAKQQPNNTVYQDLMARIRQQTNEMSPQQHAEESETH